MPSRCFLFSAVPMLLLYLMQRAQAWLPLNPQKLAAVVPDLAFNTAASFTTNTNWQNYSGEVVMSYFTQIWLGSHITTSLPLPLASHSPLPLFAALPRRERDTVGNFWVDMTRATLWVLVPFCVVGRAVAGVAGRCAEPPSLRQGRAG